MNILLTGGAGYIGSHIAVELIKQGYGVIIADNFSNSSPLVAGRIRDITGTEPTVYNTDVAAPELDRVFKENRIDAVIHLAGLKAVGESTKLPLVYYRNNLNCTINLLECMHRHHCRGIIFSSSATVYGIPSKVSLDESMPNGVCTNPYSWTKSFSEQIITDAVSAFGDISACYLRYFNPVGADKSGLIGEDPEGIPNNLMPFITQVAIGRLERLNVFGNDYPTPDGTGIRDYIHVTDLAEGHVAAIDYVMSHEGTTVINLGTGHGYSVLDMVNTFQRVNGVKVPYVFAPRRPGDIAEFFADPARAEEVLGWKAKLTLDDICRDSWNWQKKNPHGYASKA